jgi:PilZ domain
VAQRHTPGQAEQAEKANATEAERRAWVRFPCELDSACKPLAGSRESQWLGKIRNLSCGGVAITLSRRFEVGTVLSIEVQGKAEAILGTVTARVVRVASQGDGSWLLGCTFTKLLSEQDFKALL